MNKEALLSECEFKAVRSSGPGGQHVNKTSTKVVLSWDLEATQVFDEEQKERLRERLKNKISKAGILILNDDSSRSQYKNKSEVISRFFRTVEKALHRNKPRKKTKPSKSSVRKRLENKKKTAEKKSNRKRPEL